MGPEYANYEIVTQHNVGTVTVDGLECDIRYELDFQPKWGKGLQVYANGTKMYIKGPRAADLNDFGGTIANWRLSLSERATWKSGRTWNQLAGRVIRLRISLRDADLFAFQQR